MTAVDSLVWEGRFLLLARKGLHPPFGGDFSGDMLSSHGGGLTFL